MKQRLEREIVRDKLSGRQIRQKVRQQKGKEKGERGGKGHSGHLMEGKPE